MSGLLHRAGQVTGDIISLECHGCRARYAGDQLDELLIFDELRCLDPQCGSGGMIPHRTSRVEDRFPLPLTTSFTPLPNALQDRAQELGLGPHELLLLWALERHRRAMGDEVFPGRSTLARLTTMREDQVTGATR